MAPSKTIDDPSDPRPSRASSALLAGVCVFVSLVVGCTLFETVEDRDKEIATWDETSWGPVLPHKSFPADCELCHVTGSWSEIKESFTFDHAKETGHALMGAHKQARCLRCHNDRGAVEHFASLGCAGCHVDPHEGKLSPRCDSCHNERDWRPQGISAQHLEAGFPLFGAHVSTSCDSCHPNARSQDFKGAPSQCLACHQADVALATSPDHTANSMLDCEECHVPTGWTPAKFAHESFPLRGAHKQADCAECHVGGVFAGTPSDCLSCHQPAYTATARPSHMLAGFGTACQTCHTPRAWVPSQYAHSTWPLTGAHRSTACASCHSGDVYAGTPRDCNACHQPDYAATTNPNHVASGFGTSCENCHSTSGWSGANFNHSFPITSGAHNGIACANCHTTPNNYTLFSCIDCHEHPKNKMDDKHSGKSGYVYASPNCYACHPNGKD